jgi:hypothetical protein
MISLLKSRGTDDMARRNESRVWQNWLLFPVSTAFAAFCFLRYFDWAWTYSGIPTSPGSDIAGRSALLFFTVFVLFEILSARTVALLLFDAPDLGSAPLRLVARYGGGLMISLIATAVLIFTWFGLIARLL